MGNNLQKIRKSRGLSREALAELIGTSKGQIYKLERGERRMSDVWLDRLAPALETTRAAILGEDEDPMTQEGSKAPPPRMLPIVGEVRAGAWISATELEHDDRDYVPAYVPPEMLMHPAAEHLFVLRARGDSMNLAQIRDGALLACLPINHFWRPLASGDFVIAVRADHGAYEATVKEYSIRPDGSTWLLPRSDNPEHEPIKMPPRDQWPDDIAFLDSGEVLVQSVVVSELYRPLAADWP